MTRDEWVSAAVRISQKMYDEDVREGLPTLKIGEPLDPQAPAMLHLGLQFTASGPVPIELCEAMDPDRIEHFLRIKHEDMCRNVMAHLVNTAEQIKNILEARDADQGNG